MRESGVQFAVHHHGAQLAVFIGLDRFERLAVNHGNRGLEPVLEALKIAQIRRGRDGHLAAKFFGIGGDGAKGDQARRRGLLQIVQHQVGQQEMPQIVRGHADFKTFGRAQGGFQSWPLRAGVMLGGHRSRLAPRKQTFRPLRSCPGGPEDRGINNSRPPRRAGRPWPAVSPPAGKCRRSCGARTRTRGAEYA